ncbi:hypothetical protein [Paenibacillus hexagrammi]|uniref:Uncharacterized protein n=1 Tax=Paenibacillus hexagrammi TaxID=2908839 RepID=A0ABY3SRQ4_9BACL|nr:hypothetical protein [Paenibacillus sp. YPD9-1]UJF35686.1 hypothetical protein L0M14_11700 [Paenibacillus sp. YPD9-1]
MDWQKIRLTISLTGGEDHHDVSNIDISLPFRHYNRIFNLSSEIFLGFRNHHVLYVRIDLYDHLFPGN